MKKQTGVITRETLTALYAERDALKDEVWQYWGALTKIVAIGEGYANSITARIEMTKIARAALED